jgi:putative tryptophan/tyrosine transport system substrate-binding protein
MANAENPASVVDMQKVQAAARALDLDVASLEIRRAEDIAPAFAAFKGSVDVLYIPPDALVNANIIRINTLALAARLPTMYGSREYVKEGGMISYGLNFPDCSGALLTMLIRFCAGLNPPTCLLSSRPSSISSSI